MKIRKGFVSNSSSSSFCLIMSNQEEEEWLESLNVYQRKMLGHSRFTVRGERIIDGVNVVTYSGEWNTLEHMEMPNLIPEDVDLNDEELAEKYGIEDWDMYFLWEDAVYK